VMMGFIWIVMNGMRRIDRGLPRWLMRLMMEGVYLDRYRFDLVRRLVVSISTFNPQTASHSLQPMIPKD